MLSSEVGGRELLKFLDYISYLSEADLKARLLIIIIIIILNHSKVKPEQIKSDNNRDISYGIKRLISINKSLTEERLYSLELKGGNYLNVSKYLFRDDMLKFLENGPSLNLDKGNK